MTALQRLADQMRIDWDRRVQHDYRFWMGEGHLDDTKMWQSGESDFSTIAEGISRDTNLSALEIGCGVGRMLRAAASRFGRVVGVDVSRSAIDKARELIGPNPHIELVAGSGFDLNFVEPGSIDFVWSHAALACMPVPVIASYLTEIKRVLKSTGSARLQVYLGQEMLVHEHDTLHLRSFNPENFKKGVALAGFELIECRERAITEADEAEQIGLKNCIVTLKPTSIPSADADQITRALLPNGESKTASEVNPAALEAWMALNYAESLVDQGESVQAKEAVQYVINNCQAATIDTRDILERVLAKTSLIEDSQDLASVSRDNSGFLSLNEEALRAKFPEAYNAIMSQSSQSDEKITVTQTNDGAVLWRDGLCLDHAQQPRAAADAWIGRSLREERFSTAKHIWVVGFGGGYHLDSLLAQTKLPVSCCEPDCAVFRRALRERDLRSLISQLEQLVVGSDVSSNLLPEGAELLVRPQINAGDGAYLERVRSTFYSKRGRTDLHPKIAVVGPLQGGTLTTATYSYNALRRLNQRVRGIDLSGFNDGYMLFDRFVVGEPRRAGLRAQYVELVSSMLLETLDEKPVDILICMAQAPISARALTELRKRGVITVLWFVEDYLRFTYWREMAKYYDFVFTIQKGECIEQIRAAGAGEVHYVPTACDPHVHAPLNLSDEDIQRWGSPLSFVGAGYHNRQQMFSTLSHYPLKIWGSEWPTGKPFDRMVQDEARRISPEEYVKIFNATEINLNLHSSSERDWVDPAGDFVNPRTFELAACGAFQLCDNRALLPEMFELGREIVTYSTLDELKEKIEYYKNRPDERRAVAERARARALKDHTYEKRLDQMLSIIYASRYEQLRSRESTSPWADMIRKAQSHPELKERCERACARGEEPALDGLIADIVTGQGKLTETEQKLLFMHHVRSQIVRMNREEAGLKK